MQLSLGFSPCPNDTFIFDALVNNKIDTGGLAFDVYLEDVETLNEWALQGRLDVTKLSFAVLPIVLENYILLNSGSALGSGVGPLLISVQQPGTRVEKPNSPAGELIAIPGEHTTAHLLFTLAYPGAKNKIFLRYDKIEDFVLSGKGPGVIIHENRFTYEARGLHKITDLGEFWEKETGKPIPLGGIVIKRSLNRAITLQVDKLLRESIEYAFKHHYTQLTEYVRIHAREMQEMVMRKHIDLYVNKYSLDLGTGGKDAVRKLLSVYKDLHVSLPALPADIFVGEH